MTVYIIFSILFLLNLTVTFFLFKRIGTLDKENSEQFKITKLSISEIKDALFALSAQENILLDIKKSIDLIKEDTKDQRSHNKINNVMLTNLKTDLAKIISRLEKQPLKKI